MRSISSSIPGKKKVIGVLGVDPESVAIGVQIERNALRGECFTSVKGNVKHIGDNPDFLRIQGVDPKMLEIRTKWFGMCISLVDHIPGIAPVVRSEQPSPFLCWTIA